MNRKYVSYDELLKIALAEFDSFSLVWRNGAYDESAFDLERVLEPWLLEDYSAYEWPGTVLSEKARVCKYRVTPESIDALRCVESVFDFMQPSFPEDLAFYANAQVRFGSVAHEGMAWFS